jgi:ribonuclease Z
VTAVVPGDTVALRKDMMVEFFTTDHWVPTLGSRLVWRRHHLLPELKGLSGDEIASRRRDGEPVTEAIETDLLAYCADSGPGVLEAGSSALGCEVLLLECSFFRAADRERAARYGHLHLDDILDRIAGFRCRHLVLLHASRRHRLREVEEILDERLKPKLQCSLHHLMTDWD